MLTTTTTLTDLEPEVLSLILEYVDDASPQTTRSVACVNRYLNLITNLIAHRHKVLNINAAVEEGFLAELDSWSAEDTLASIRTITVKGRVLPPRTSDDSEDDEDQPQSPSSDDETPWAPLVTLLSKIGKLRQFDWNVRHPLPVIVLEALEQHQKYSTLRIFNYARNSAVAIKPEPIELLLAKSPALTHLRYVTENSWDSSDIQEIAFRGIIGSAPNLKYAGLIVLRYFDMMANDNSELDSIKSRFYKHSTPSTSVKQLTLDGVEISRQTLVDWSSTVDLASLEMVKFTKGFPTLDYFQSAAHLLPNLKHFSLNLRLLKIQPPNNHKRAMVAALKAFMQSCSPLQTLSLWSWMGQVSLNDLLDRHGPTLETLQLHEREAGGRDVFETMSIEDIRAIRTSCPNLKDLTFDLKRTNAKLKQDSDANMEFYDELAKFKNLDALQIYFDLGAAYLNWKSSCGYGYRLDPADFADESDALDENDQGAAASNANKGDDSGDNDELGNPPSLGADWLPTKASRLRASPFLRPSLDTEYEVYIRHVWKTVFGSRKHGARQLDIKVGDWEGLPSSPHQELKRHFVVMPNERDDKDEATVKKHQGGKSHLREPR